MSLNLPIPTPHYDARTVAHTHQEIERADKLNRKLLRDVEIAGKERLILSSPDGTRWKLVVSNLGVVTATAV